MPENYSFSFGVATHQLQIYSNNNFIQFLTISISIKYITFHLFIKARKENWNKTKHTLSCCAIINVKWSFHNVSSRTQTCNTPHPLASLFHWRLRKGRNTVHKIGSWEKGAINMSYKPWDLIWVELLYLCSVHSQHISRPVFSLFLITILQAFLIIAYWSASYFHSSFLHSFLQSSITLLNEFHLV